MKNSEFAQISSKVEKGQWAAFSRSIDGRVYTRKFIPEERLILLGAGHIAQPLCRMAAMLDYYVIVVDDRMSFANTQRFPDAAEVVCDSFAKAIRELQLRSTDYVCVITRGHRWDGDCLREILSGTQPSYLGMIGSARRVKGLLGLLAEEGYGRERLSLIHAPIGLKINALTPAEIAVSICGQLVQHRRKTIQPEEEETLTQTNADRELLRFLADDNGRKAMMLVLDSSGSTPVKPGAIMAMDSIGRTYGTIGGGCSEADVISRARRIIGTGRSAVVEVDMSNDMAAEEGMVCGGHMHVLIEDIT